MKQPNLPSDKKATPIWVLISAIPLQIGSIIAMLWILSSTNRNKAYSLLFPIPIIGPIISYVLMESKDRYISSMSGWIFVGQVLSAIIFELISIFGY